MFNIVLILKAILIVLNIIFSYASFSSSKEVEKPVSNISKTIGVVFILNAIAILIDY